MRKSVRYAVLENMQYTPRSLVRIKPTCLTYLLRIVCDVFGVDSHSSNMEASHLLVLFISLDMLLSIYS